MEMEKGFSGRVGIQQRVLPAYRAPFFEMLANRCQGGLAVFAGQPQPGESISTAGEFNKTRFTAGRNRHFLTPDHPFYLCWQDGLLAWLGEWDPDVLIAEANPRYPTTRKALDWMAARGRPVIGWGLGAPPARSIAGKIRARGRASFLQRFSALIAYSRRGAWEYRALGLPEDKVFVATNAVSPPPKHPLPARPPIFDPRSKVLFVGRLQARKRVDLLLEACAGLPPDLQPELTIVGEGPAREQFEQGARKTYPQANFPGALYGPELAACFAAADLFVLPGTGGLAVQEAMGYGLPVIAAQGDGTQEDLVRPANGWLVPPGDRDALEDALLQALENPGRLRAMGTESYRIVSEEINIESMAGVFVEVFGLV